MFELFSLFRLRQIDDFLLKFLTSLGLDVPNLDETIEGCCALKTSFLVFLALSLSQASRLSRRVRWWLVLARPLSFLVFLLVLLIESSSLIIRVVSFSSPWAMRWEGLECKRSFDLLAAATSYRRLWALAIDVDEKKFVSLTCTWGSFLLSLFLIFLVERFKVFSAKERADSWLARWIVLRASSR